MSLLGWLGRPEPLQRSPSPLLKYRTVERVVLGVLGTRSNIRVEDLEMNILAPVVEAWGLPDEILVPAEGDSSQALQSWATSKEIPVRLVTCDWAKQGKRAGAMRDARIQREATHLVMLQGPRSNALMQLATRLNRKGRHVVISERPSEPVKSLAESVCTK